MGGASMRLHAAAVALLVVGVVGNVPSRPASTVMVTDYCKSCVSLAWNAVVNATAYELWYTRASNGASAKLYDGPGLSFTMKNAVAGETYVFFYKSGNDFGTSAASEPSTSVLIPTAKRWALYVSDQSTHRIVRFHADGQYNRDFILSGSGGLRKPWGVEPGTSGDIFVSSEGTNSVLRFEQCSGASLCMLTYVPGQPRGLSFHTPPGASEP